MLICEIDCKYYLNRVETQYFAPFFYLLYISINFCNFALLLMHNV